MSYHGAPPVSRADAFAVALCTFVSTA